MGGEFSLQDDCWQLVSEPSAFSKYSVSFVETLNIEGGAPWPPAKR
jgi:hypothetical protein